MIGGLLRFAPGRLGARTLRAPRHCGIRWWVVSWLPSVTPKTSWTPSPARAAGLGVLSWAGMATGSALVARCVSRGRLGSKTEAPAYLVIWR